jgi:hypothetical protein
LEQDKEATVSTGLALRQQISDSISTLQPSTTTTLYFGSTHITQSITTGHG